MNEFWPTEHADLATALGVIQRHIDEDEQGLSLAELTWDDETDEPELNVSPWVSELAEKFLILYGRKRGEFVTQMVISRCITHGHTLH